MGAWRGTHVRIDQLSALHLGSTRPTSNPTEPPTTTTTPTAALLPILAAAGSALLPGPKAAHAYRDLRMSPETRVVAASECFIYGRVPPV